MKGCRMLVIMSDTLFALMPSQLNQLDQICSSRLCLCVCPCLSFCTTVSQVKSLTPWWKGGITCAVFTVRKSTFCVILGLNLICFNFIYSVIFFNNQSLRLYRKWWQIIITRSQSPRWHLQITCFVWPAVQNPEKFNSQLYKISNSHQ